MLFRIRLACGLCIALLLACAPEPPDGRSGDEGAAALRPAALAISDAYVNRPVPGRDVTAAYMVIENRGEQAQTLVAFSSPVAGAVELHSLEHRDGKMQMRRLDSLVVEPGSQVELAPGGHHLMLFRVDSSLQQKEEVEFVLRNANDEAFTVSAAVRDLRDNDD